MAKKSMSNAKSSARAGIESLQPTRTTFKLSPEVVTSLKIMSKRGKVSIKEVIDHLCSWVHVGPWEGFPENKIEIIRVKYPHSLSVRKTYVISRYSLDHLNEFSSKYQIPRDIVLDNVTRSFFESWLLEEERIKNLKEEALPKLKSIKVTLDEVMESFDLISGTDNALKLKNIFSSLIDEVKSQLHDTYKTFDILSG